jgi:DNA-binding response OmpR family regulator
MNPITPPTRPLSVLIVDDDPDGATTLAVLLRLYGHDARVARDGAAALWAAAERPPDVLLMEIGLPGEDGFALAERLCDRLARRPLLVAHTGHGTAADREKSRLRGFDHHLLKPASPEALAALLRAHAESVAANA